MSSLARMETPRAALISGEWKLIVSEYGLPWYGTLDEEEDYGGLEAQVAVGDMNGGGNNGDGALEVSDDDASSMMSNCNSDPGTGLGNYLFNVVDDPNETNNLYADSSHASVVNQLMDTLKGHLQREVISKG